MESEVVRPARAGDAARVQFLLSSEGLESEFVPREFVVAEHGGRVIACARAKPLPEGGTELGSVVVAKEFRRRGLARDLMSTALLGARHPVYALTVVPELAARAGFEPIEAAALPTSLQGKAGACNSGVKPWVAMRLRRITIAPLPPAMPETGPEFLDL